MDRYDKAIEILIDTDSYELDKAWDEPQEHDAGCLFAYVGSDPFDGRMNGCLTQVKFDGQNAETMQLALDIKACDEIVSVGEMMEMNQEQLRSSLEVFADWQRRLDKELDRDWSKYDG